MVLRNPIRSLAALAVVALLAGCAPQAETPPPTSSSSSTPTPTPVAQISTCVTDPADVVKRLDDLPTTPMPDYLLQRIDAAAQAGFAAAAAPGAIVAVQSPKGVFLRAYGVADPATGAPMTTDLNQRIGSITKTFTAAMIMQLVADGSVSLDDPISRYVKGVQDGDTITLRMLADMTSGLTSYTSDPDWQAEYFADPHRVWSPNELVRIGLSLEPQDFAPGTAFDYSNTNTVLLGKVIEKVTGVSYSKALKERILVPLGLDHTIFPDGSAEFPEPHAQGFTLQGGQGTPDAPTNATDWNPSWGWAAGEMISNATDLLRFGRAEATGAGLLPQVAQVVRLTSFREFNGSGNGGYGIGWGCQNGWVGHAGELPGYNSSMFYDTNNDLTIVTLTNSDIPSGDCAAGTLTDNPTDLVCSSPATRIFASIADALGRPFVPQNQ